MASVKGRKARVTFDYEAEQPDEITLKLGDIIENIQTEDVGWCKGDVHGKRGLFPSNFVEFIDGDGGSDEEASSPAAEPDEAIDESIDGRKAKVLFDYGAENEDELSLDIGTVIDLIREVEDGWWEGKINGQSGVFPSNFVELVPVEAAAKDAKPVPPAPTKTVEEEEPAQDMYENMRSSEDVEMEPEASNITEAEEEDISKNKRASFIESKKKGGGMGFGNIISSDLLSGINLKRVEKKKEEPKEKKATVEPEKLVPKKPSLLSSLKRKAPPVPPVPQPQEPQAPPAKKVIKAKVVFEYEPQNEDELELRMGDTITIINKEVFDTPGWMEGELEGKTGLFPDNFVEILPDEQIEKTTKEKEKPVPPSPQKTTAAPVQEKRAPPPAPEEEKKDLVDAPKPAGEMRKALTREPKKPPPPKESSKPVIDALKPSVPPKKPLPPKPNIEKKPHVHKKAVPRPPTDNKKAEHKKELPKPVVEIKEQKPDEKESSLRATAGENEAFNLDSVEPHETLTHLTTNRAKLQQKRPPSRDIRYSGDTLLNDDVRDSGEPEVEPKEPAWKREAREVRESKETKKLSEKVTPPVPLVKEKKVLPLPVPKKEDILNSRNELRKSWKEEPLVAKKPTPTEDAELRKSIRDESPVAKKPLREESPLARKPQREESPLAKKPTSVGSSDEFNALRDEVTELRSLMKELSQKFVKLEKKHADDVKHIEHRLKEEIEQLTNDFDEERSHNARLKIEVDRLKKKLRRGSDAE